MQWRSEIKSYGQIAAFEQLFGRDVVSNGGMYFRAPAHEVQDYSAQLASNRGFPQCSAYGKPWKIRRVLAPAVKASVARHRESIADRLVDGQEFPDVFVNLRQRPGFTPVSACIPTLLRGSTIWSFSRERPLLAFEAMETLGYGMYAEPRLARASFADALLTKSSCQVQHLAGNGMHAAATGSVLMFVLACTCRVHVVD